MLKPTAWLTDGKCAQSALIVVNRLKSDPSTLDTLAKYCSKRILLDGASNNFAFPLLESGFDIDLAIGDGDSITRETIDLLKRNNVSFTKIADQDSTDFMKALNHIAQQWPDIETVYAYNAYGGRVDHSWHSMYCMGYAEKLGIRLYLISEENITMRLAPGNHTISTPLNLVGKTCGFCPLLGASLITIRGFEWDVTEWECSFDTHLSTSNHLLRDEVEIKTDKPLAFTVERRRPDTDGSV